MPDYAFSLFDLDMEIFTETDNALSKINADDEIGTYTVTLSAAKGLSRWAERCFAEFTLSVANVLSMTAL